MFANLIAAIESDLNNIALQIQEAIQKQQGLHLVSQLTDKREKLKDLAMEYVGLENKYRELSGANGK
jgi:Zn-finger domain-containing protein